LRPFNSLKEAREQAEAEALLLRLQAKGVPVESRADFCPDCDGEGLIHSGSAFADIPGQGWVRLNLAWSRACLCRRGRSRLALWRETQCASCDHGYLWEPYQGKKSLGASFCPNCGEGRRLLALKEEAIRAKAQLAIMRLVEESGLACGLRDKTFNNFLVVGKNETEREEREAARAQVLTAAQGGQSVILIGPCGIGKSHLAAAYLNLGLSHGQSGIFRTFARLMDSLRDTIGSEQASWGERLELLCSVRVLVIDDLDKTKFTEKAVEALFTLVDERIARNLPTVITINKTLAQLWERLYKVSGVDDGQVGALRSRLGGMAFNRVGWSCSDWRLEPLASASTSGGNSRPLLIAPASTIVRRASLKVLDPWNEAEEF
jgi:DNA replication protein DnaC